MDYKSALEKLESLRAAMEGYNKAQGTDKFDEANRRVAELYGECEELITRIVGVAKIQVPPSHGAPGTIYPNLIEAGYLSGWRVHQHAGFLQIQKVIGKVKQLAADPQPLPTPPSVTGLIQMLGRFRECCQYVSHPPKNEREVQDILWIMLRSQYDRVDRENTLPRFGVKAYRPDFGLPDLQVLVEVKYVGEKTEPAAIQEELLADVPGYLKAASGFVGIVEVIYDHAQKLRDARKLIEDLQGVDGIVHVAVVPGIAPGVKTVVDQ